MTDLEAVKALLGKSEYLSQRYSAAEVAVTQLCILTAISRNLALIANPVKTIPSEAAIRDLLDICGEIYAVSDGTGLIYPHHRERLNSAAANVERGK
jgi:hypothetical protein